MFNYKIARKQTEINQARKFIAENGFEVPSNGIFVIAENVNKNGSELLGVGVLQTKSFIEPFICNNPIVANNIYRMIEGIGLLSESDLFVIINEKKLGNLMEKLGYEKINLSIWRKKWD